MKSMKLGQGGRFEKLKEALARKGLKNPAGAAANIGREKLGKEKFQHLATAGKRRHEGKK